MLGGFIGFIVATAFATSRYGVVAVLGIFLVSFVILAAFGAAYEFALIKRILKRPSSEILISSILVTVGTSFVIENVGYIYMPKFIPFQLSVFTIPLNLAQLTFSFGGVYLDGVKILALIIVGMSSFFLYIFSRQTYLGKAMRAIAQNRESAKLMGVNLQRISILTFALGSGFGALAGVSIAMTNSMNPGFGLTFTIALLSVMVLGGTRSLLGATRRRPDYWFCRNVHPGALSKSLDDCTSGNSIHKSGILVSGSCNSFSNSGTHDQADRAVRYH